MSLKEQAQDRMAAVLAGDYGPDTVARPIAEYALELETKLNLLQAENDSICRLVAKMHEAAVGEVRGPIRGLIEDVQDLYKRAQRECSHGEYKVWGTDQCGSCMGGRVTLYYLRDGVCFNCQNKIDEAGL